MCIWGRRSPRSSRGWRNKWHFTGVRRIKHCIANWKTSCSIKSWLLHSFCFCFSIKQFSESAPSRCLLQGKDYIRSHDNFIHGKFGWSDRQQHLKTCDMTDQFNEEWVSGICTEMKFVMSFSALNLLSLTDFHQSSSWEHVGGSVGRIGANQLQDHHAHDFNKIWASLMTVTCKHCQMKQYRSWSGTSTDSRLQGMLQPMSDDAVQ